MNKEYKYALFDWDGCIADTLSESNTICKLLAAKKGIKFSDDDFRAVVGNWNKLAQVIDYSDVQELKIVFAQITNERIAKVALNPNAKETLQLLHQNNVAIGIVSSSSREIIIQQAKHNGVLGFISQIVGFEDVVKTKPDPEPVLKLLNLMAGNSENSLLIGDTANDIIAAGRAGVDSIWYAPQFNREVYGETIFDEYKPIAIIEDLFDFGRFFIN
jgi:HAD superfamily hydrolase (TIGR01509 family)